jgi:predicted subunit of tRNA(5-methylaminomethyl-2-thiouridylate) methyltransferase
MDFPPAAAAVSEATVRQQAQASLGEDRVLEIVREVVRETVEKICREQFPSVASQVVAQEIEALKKRVEEET